MFEMNGKYTTAKIMIDYVDESCIKQINTFINHPAFNQPVAIMPDTHAGKGSVIGFTMPMTSKIIPNVIGVDIGCGMLSFNIGPELPVSKELMDHRIRKVIPFGMNVHNRGVIHMKNDFPWASVNTLARKFTMAYRDKFNKTICPPVYDFDWFEEKCKTIGANMGRIINSVGTLGGGNHFIEVGKGLDGNYWITIHTGSRNFGKRICEYWQDIAVKRIKEKYTDNKQDLINKAKETLTGKELYDRIKEIKANKLNIDISGLEFLEDDDVEGYLFDMIFAQMYAEVNRLFIKLLIKDELKIGESYSEIETVHNFIDFRDFIIRKGAIRSYVGEKMIIPFNMKDGLLICEGKSNEEWNCSAPHGAGRVFSRSEAKRRIDLEAFKDQMKDIYSTSVCQGTLDEAPDAYKDPKIIEEAIEPTAKIIDRIVPIINLKATETVEE